MSIANSEFIPSIGGCVLPLIGGRQIVRKNEQDCLRVLHRNCKITDEHLKTTRYLIGEQLTVADLFTVGMLSPAFMVFHKVFHTEYPTLTRWFYDVYNIPMYKEVAGDLPLLDLPLSTLPRANGPSENGRLTLPLREADVTAGAGTAVE